MDSLKKAENALEKDYVDESFHRFQIKDAVFDFVHGIEILIKLIIRQQNEEGIFDNKKDYQEAIKKLSNPDLDVLIEFPDLKTITITGAINKVSNQMKSIKGLELNLKDIVKKRNQIMHSTVNMSDEELVSFLGKLRLTLEQVKKFFAEHIENFSNDFAKEERLEPMTEEELLDDALASHAIDVYEDERLEY